MQQISCASFDAKMSSCEMISFYCWLPLNDEFEYNCARPKTLSLHPLLTFLTNSGNAVKVSCNLGSLPYCKYKLKSSEENVILAYPEQQ